MRILQESIDYSQKAIQAEKSGFGITEDEVKKRLREVEKFSVIADMFYEVYKQIRMFNLTHNTDIETMTFNDVPEWNDDDIERL